MRNRAARCIAVVGCLALFVLAPNADAATLWTGPPIDFAKASFADPTLPANQDRITPNVSITRGSNQGLFNAALEAAYVPDASPANTEWAAGSLASGMEHLEFSDWRTAMNANPPAAIGVPYVVHILDDDIYLELTLTSWGVGGTSGPGGAFSYTRSTPAAEPVPGAIPALLLLGTLGFAWTRLRSAAPELD